MRSLSRALTLSALLIQISGCASGSRHTISKEAKVGGLLNIASASIDEGDFISALEYLNQAVEIDDRNPTEYHLYALAYLGKKEPRLAADAARRAIRLDPQFSAAKNTLGKILMDQEKYSEAEHYLQEAANDLLNRDSALPKLNLGILYFKTLKFKAAELWLNRSLEERSNYSCMAEYYIGKIRLSENNYPAAEKAFRTAAKNACSGMSEAHLAVGQSLAKQKKYDEARAKFVEIQQLFPNSPAFESASRYLRDLP